MKKETMPTFYRFAQSGANHRCFSIKTCAILVLMTHILWAQIPEVLSWKVIDSIPHNPTSFTQGLIYHNEKLFESTGSVGRESGVFVIDPTDGSEIHGVSASDIFGEGLAFDGSMLWQLSWKSEYAIIYSFPDIQRIATIPYTGEGWGLTYIPKTQQFVMSDGSAVLTFRDQQFTATKKITVTLNGNAIDQLNELEMWNDKVLANRWYSDTIFVINPDDGIVEGILDLQALRISCNPDITAGNVLNGIATIDAQNLWVTGKRWPWLYKITVSQDAN